MKAEEILELRVKCLETDLKNVISTWENLEHNYKDHISRYGRDTEIAINYRKSIAEIKEKHDHLSLEFDDVAGALVAIRSER